MNPWTKYSYFIEQSCALGRNGKRLLHGGATAGAMIGIAKYANIEVLNENPVKTALAAAATGFVATAVTDHLVMTREEMLKYYAKQASDLGPDIQSQISAYILRKTG